MTICIAAECQFEPLESAIVLCTDAQEGSALGKAETAQKQKMIRPGWYALTSGYQTDINALHLSYRKHFAKAGKLDETNIAAALRLPLQERMREKLDEYIQGRYGIPYSEFIAKGKGYFPDDIFRNAVTACEQMELRASLVIAGFLDPHTPFLCQTDDGGRLQIRENFATVGEGSYLATSVLFKRKQQSWLSLPHTLYNVFEAKKYSEGATSVGTSTIITILKKDGMVAWLSAEAEARLAEWYQFYGPKSVPDDIELPENGLESL